MKASDRKTERVSAVAEIRRQLDRLEMAEREDSAPVVEMVVSKGLSAEERAELAMLRMSHTENYRRKGHQKGDRVRITRNDKYFGKEGVLVRPCGERGLSWDVRVEVAGGKSLVIQKTTGCLDRIPPSPLID